MNGRCTTDPLDRAEDICEACGEQFCSVCLLFPRGRKQPPTCKACALANSGLRGSASSSKGISKREWKKRRKQLEEELTDVVLEEPAIEYFHLEEPDEKAEKRPTKPQPEPVLEASEPESSPLGSIKLAEPIPEPPATSEPEPVASEPDRVPAGLVYEPTQVLADMPAADVSVNPLAVTTEPAAPIPAAAPPAAAQPAAPIPAAPIPAAPIPAAPIPAAMPPMPSPVAAQAHAHAQDPPVAPTHADHPAPLQERPAPTPRQVTPPPSAPVSATESAADLLAKLKANEPIRSQFHAGRGGPDLEADPFSSAPSPQPDPFAAPPHQPAPHQAPPMNGQPANGQSDPFTTAHEVPTHQAPTHQAPPQPAQPQTAPPQPAVGQQPVEQLLPPAQPAPTAPSRHVDPFAEFDEPTAAAPRPAPQPEPTPAWTPPTPPPRGTNTDDIAPAPSAVATRREPEAPTATAAPPAPPIAAAPPIERTAPVRPSGLSFNNASAQPSRATPAQASPVASSAIAAPGPKPSAAANVERPADTDANGNWIPPNLRGMAAPAKAGEAELPKRRRTD